MARVIHCVGGVIAPPRGGALSLPVLAAPAEQVHLDVTIPDVAHQRGIGTETFHKCVGLDYRCGGLEIV
jgi:hypothetical protein